MNFTAIGQYTSEFRQALYEASSKTTSGFAFTKLPEETRELNIQLIDSVNETFKHNSKGD